MNVSNGNCVFVVLILVATLEVNFTPGRKFQYNLKMYLLRLLRRQPLYYYDFFKVPNYSHLLVGLAGEGFFAKVFHELADQA